MLLRAAACSGAGSCGTFGSGRRGACDEWSRVLAETLQPEFPALGVFDRFPASRHICSVCYASLLGGCGGGLSREHYISQSVLDLFGPELVVSGAAWMAPGESQSLPVAALTAKILCQHHNTGLSTLDATAGGFARALNTIFQVRSSQDPPVQPTETTIDGALLERWLLKVMTGALAAGILRKGRERFEWQPDRMWLSLLFGLVPFEREQGLYVHPTQFNVKANEGVGMRPLWRGSECTGGLIRLYGLELAVFAKFDGEPWLRERTTGRVTPALRRPRQLGFERANGDWTVKFTWPGLYSANGIRFGQGTDSPR